MRRYLWIAAAVFALDLLSKLAAVKYLVRHAEVSLAPFLNLTLVYNRGAAFGFLSDAGGWQNWFFIGVAALISVIIFTMLRRLAPQDRQAGIALALILGGALGNVLDRLSYGYVIDFIDIYYRSWHWPAFNLADSAITIGAVLFVLDSLGVRIFRPRAA